MVHLFCGESRLARMAQRTFVARNASRRCGRDVVRRLTQHPCIGTGMTGLAGSVGNPRMGIGQADWRPGCRGMAIGTVRVGRHMIGQLDIDIRIRGAMAARAGR